MEKKALTADTIVGEVLRRHPEAQAIFVRYGVDTCCGGHRKISEGARVAGADLQRLLAELARVTS